MKQHTFSVGNNPRVVVSRVKGNLIVHTWDERSIGVRIAGENEDSSTAQLYNEGDTVFIRDCRGDIELSVPYEKKLFGSASVSTNVNVTNLDGNVEMEHVGNVDMTNIRGDIVLSEVDGNLRTTNVLKFLKGKDIGGSAFLENIPRIEIGAIGAALIVTHAETVKLKSVGSAVHAEQIAVLFQCGSVGGSCEIRNSAHAEVSLSNVGGSLHMDGVARLPSCNVGGSLTALVNVPSASSTRITVGGSATLMLPRNVNLGMRIMAGGTISGEAVNRKCSNIATLTYGNSSSSLNITAGGSVNLSWATDSTYPNTVIGYDVPAATPPKTIQREAILKMVEQGRITPEEGNMLLEALGE
ncbi:MAG: hypothetical protein NVS4B12_16260 [Ktedonobacteraceae bacterium]